MAPRKSKTQTKRNNNFKIKGKVTGRKRDQKPVKKDDASEKPLTNLKWLNKVVAQGSVKNCEALPDWFKNSAYKRKLASDMNVSEYEEYQPQEEEEKSFASVSDASEECNCSHSKFSDNNKGRVLKASSDNSLVSKYIKSGMNQVASFIVESAIRFGEQHGVVVPDKDTPNLYEITPPDSRFAEKCRKIRFKMPKKTVSYEDGKKRMWKNYNQNGPLTGKRGPTPMSEWDINRPTKSSSWNSTADSLEEILPILERLKEEGDIVTSDLDLEKLRKTEDDGSKEKERNWGRFREMDRERDRERDWNRVRTGTRGKERLREQLRTLKKRYKGLGLMSEKDSEDNEYQQEEMSRWKKFRRDSLDLGRQRMRTTNASRKPGSKTTPPY